MTIRVVDRWKGTDADTVRLMSQGMCDFRFAVGTRAVVFAYGRPTALTTSLCLPTAREADAAETLRLLGPPQSTEGQPPLVHRREARIHKQLQSP